MTSANPPVRKPPVRSIEQQRRDGNQITLLAQGMVKAGLDMPAAEEIAVAYAETLTPPIDEAIARAKVQTAFSMFKPDPLLEQTAEEPWNLPKPLPQLLPVAPSMPVEIIPEPLREWLQDISERLQVPMELVAVPSVVALSSIIGRQVGINPKQNDDWLVLPNLWGMIVAPPSMKKTPAMNEVLKALGPLVTQAHTNYQQQLAEFNASHAVTKAQIEANSELMRKAAKATELVELERLKRELATLQTGAEKEPVERRYRITDSTVEKLLVLFQQNPKGLFLFRDELSGWLRMLDKPGREGDREFFQETWDGNGHFTSDRISRGTVSVDGLCLSIFGGIQPGKLEALLVSAALEGGVGDDGMLQRFQLAVYPERRKLWTYVDRHPDQAARQRAYRIYEILDNIDAISLGIRPRAFSQIPAIQFDARAQELFKQWLTRLENRLKAKDLEPAMESHLSKYNSLMPSLALIFHLIDWADSYPRKLKPVSFNATQLAVQWTNCLELHARKIYAVVLRSDLSGAHALAKKIHQGKVASGNSVRDIWKHHWQGLATPADVHDALNVLRTANWIRIQTVTTDGRPKDVIELNPEIGSIS